MTHNDLEKYYVSEIEGGGGLISPPPLRTIKVRIGDRSLRDNRIEAKYLYLDALFPK